MAKKKLHNQDSRVVHRETFDNEDKIFKQFDKRFGKMSVENKPPLRTRLKRKKDR